jgi:hypothetical protein
MLRSLKELERYTVSATDGEIGSVVNFLLDDERWVVRYLVVETGGIMEGRQVLITPISFRQAEWATHRFHLALTVDQIRSSPGIDVDLPVSRQHERDYNAHYGYPVYWGDAGIWGVNSNPGLLAAGALRDPLPEVLAEVSVEPPCDAHLRSAREIRGYHIQGSDEAIGHLEDLVVDDVSWQVRYLVVDTSNWWFGKKVLIAPYWASQVSWEERKVYLDLSRKGIRNHPEWNPNLAINREYEERLYDYYGRPVYWDSAEREGQTPKRHLKDDRRSAAPPRT